MTWALRRQILYTSIVVLFLAGIAFAVIYPKLNVAPTCFDKKQNGAETGVDCGGSCAIACLAEVDPVSVLWARSFRVIPGRYNAVAYLENHNKDKVINKISYRFRFSDANNVYIGKREGTTFVPPSGRFAVFEPAIDVGNSIPVYVTFEFTEVPTWVSVNTENVAQIKVDVSDINLTNPDTDPKLSATITNNSFFIIPNVNVVAILYDANGNAVSTSRTFLDMLNPMEKTDVNFTWREPIPTTVVAKEIIPEFNIFTVKLK